MQDNIYEAEAYLPRQFIATCCNYSLSTGRAAWLASENSVKNCSHPGVLSGTASVFNRFVLRTLKITVKTKKNKPPTLLYRANGTTRHHVLQHASTVVSTHMCSAAVGRGKATNIEKRLS
jgi:hypothetical protein